MVDNNRHGGGPFSTNGGRGGDLHTFVFTQFTFLNAFFEDGINKFEISRKFKILRFLIPIFIFL
jgi:hypothetical protein